MQLATDGVETITNNATTIASAVDQTTKNLSEVVWAMGGEVHSSSRVLNAFSVPTEYNARHKWG